MPAAASYPMDGASAVPSISPCSTIAGPVAVAVMPVTHCSAKLRADAASSATDCNRLYAASGIIVFSSKYPPAPASATAASFPTT